MDELTVAIDFGTSNTVAVGSRGGRDPRVVTIDGAPRMASAVFAAPDGQLVVGGDAVRMARSAPSRVELHPKSRIDEGVLLLGDTTVDLTAAVRAVLAKVCTDAARQFDSAVDQLVLTHPADWGALRLGTLTTAAAGLARRTSLVPEPVAAAAQHGMPVGSSLLVLDFGGGTCDAAAVRRDPTGYRVLACAGLPDLGGDDIDQRLVDHVLARRTELADLGSSAETGDARDWLLLRQDARTAKELLSRHEHAEIASHGVEPLRIDRAEFDGLVAVDIARAVALLAEVRNTAGIRLDSVYLVGGSSRLRPLVSAVRERTGLTVHPAHEPEMCVAWGALALPDGQDTTTRPAAPVPAAPTPAPPPRRRRGPLLAGIAAVAAVGLVAVLFATSGTKVAGTATGAARGPSTQAPESAASGFPRAKPGEELAPDGEPERENLAAGQKGQYSDTLDDVTVEVGLDSVAVTSAAAPAGYRWIRAQVTARHIGKPSDEPFGPLYLHLDLLDDRGQAINAPPGTAENCPGAPGPNDEDTIAPGQSGTACRDFLVPSATPVKAVVFGDEPLSFGSAGDTPLQWPADIPAAGGPATLPDPVGEIGGDPAEVGWGQDFVTVQFDRVDEPSAYFPDLEVRPGTRVVLVRALVTASGTNAADTQLFKYLDPVDDRGLRVLDAYDDFAEPSDCPKPEEVPAGETSFACVTYMVDADMPVAGFALGVDDKQPDTWTMWGNEES